MSRQTQCQAVSSPQEPRSHTCNNKSDIPDTPEPAVAILGAAPATSNQEVVGGLLPDAVNELPVRDIAIAEAESPSSGEGIGTASNLDSPLRIVVHCLSHKNTRPPV